MAKMVGSDESSADALCGPSEVAAKVERLLCDAISKAETVLKQLPQHGTRVTVSVKDPNGMRESLIQPIEEQENPEIKGSSSLILNERPGVRYLCCDRFFKCGERNLVAREIWPADGGCIELNRNKLKRFILENEARSRKRAGGSQLEQITENESQPISNDDNTLATESSTYPNTLVDRANACEVQREKGGASPVEINFTTLSTISNDNNKSLQQQNIPQTIEYSSSDVTLSSITETPETLISDTTEFTSQNANESTADGQESSLEAYEFMQNRGDQLVPVTKADGTIVIPGIVRVNNIDQLNGVVLELDVLIKSPDESRRFNVKIDCPEFEPKSIEVNGLKKYQLVENNCC